MNKVNPSNHIAKCLTLIESKLGWGDSSHWATQDFISLSEKIFEATGTQLSQTTLKRVWGKVQYDSNPTPTTLNTLASFAGYENWRNFVSEYTDLKKHSAEPVPTYLNKKFRFKPILFGSMVLLLAIFATFLGLTSFSEKTTPIDGSACSFESHPIAVGLPNTVVFKYDLADIKGKHFQLQMNWNPEKRMDIDPHAGEASMIYYYPGYYKAKLVADGNILKEHDLYIPTDGWMATRDLSPKPRYYFQHELIRNGRLSIDAKEEKENQDKRLTFAYVKDFGDINSDNVKLEVELKNTFQTGIDICQKTEVHLICSQGIFIIPMAIPGCTGDLFAMCSEQALSGENKDFSGLGTDFEGWQNFQLRLQNRQLSIYLNKQEALTHTYQEHAGKVVGLRVRFVGSGELNYVKMWDEHGHVFFEDDFLEEL